MLPVDTDHRIRIRVIECLKHLRNGEARMPGSPLAVYENHSVIPFALNTSSTSGKSIPRRLTVSNVGIPPGFHPLRI